MPGSKRSSDPFNSRLSPGSWLVREKGWNPKRQSHYESVLAVGNGRVGSRAALEEVPHDSLPGTFLAGIFDSAGSVVDELVNLPNPFELRAFADGQKVSVEAMKVLSHERILDMRRGLLLRRTVFGKGLGGRLEFRTARFVSRADPHTAVLRAWLSSPDNATGVTVAGGIGHAVANTEGYWEGPKRHFDITEAATGRRASYLGIRMVATGERIGYAWANLPARRVGAGLQARLGKGGTLCLTRIVHLMPAGERGPGSLRRECLRGLARAVRRGVPSLLSGHERAWAALWDVSDITVSRAPAIQRAMRFNVYHLLAGGAEGGIPAGVGVKCLTGEGYRGHYFWDTEIYSLPFYSLNHPAMARQVLRYRFARLERARCNARAAGYRGALYPWESARTGAEATPYFPDGRGGLYLWETGTFEHHIVADVPLGLMNHVAASGDDRLMGAGGLELLAETARFWASRTAWNRRTGRFDIRGVIGPDEYHIAVDNNAYTNFMARWNLETAASLLEAHLAGRTTRSTGLFRRLRLGAPEIARWRRIAGRIAGTAPGSAGEIIEQFDGYFRLRHVPLPARSRSGMPGWPPGTTEAGAVKTQLIKQADVVLLMLLFPDLFTPAQKAKSYAYYEDRTLHMSSLSACTYALAGLEFGVPGRAMKYFLASLYTDLDDIQGNTAKGIHTAACGGNWQAMVRGFGGAAIRDGVLCLDPRVPREWGVLRYSLRWRDNLVRVQARPGSVLVRNGGKSALETTVFGRPVSIPPGRSVERRNS